MRVGGEGSGGKEGRGVASLRPGRRRGDVCPGASSPVAPTVATFSSRK